MSRVKVKMLEWKEGCFPDYLIAITPFCKYRIFCNDKNEIEVEISYLWKEINKQYYVLKNLEDAQVFCQGNHAKWVKHFIEI